VTYDYNADGRLVSRQDGVATQPSTYDYNANGQLAAAQDALTGATRTYNYDATSGELAAVTLASGASTAYQYDNRGRAKDIAVKDPAGKVLQDTAYGFDADGNVTSQQVTGAAAQPTGGSYTYDLAGRLATWTPQDGSPPHTYGYDPAGNRTGDSSS